MHARYLNGLAFIVLALAVGVTTLPASAQYTRPGPPMPPGQEEAEDEAPPPRGQAPDVRGGRPDYRGPRPPGPPPGPPPGRRDALRARMFELRQACQDG